MTIYNCFHYLRQHEVGMNKQTNGELTINSSFCNYSHAPFYRLHFHVAGVQPSNESKMHLDTYTVKKKALSFECK